MGISYMDFLRDSLYDSIWGFPMWISYRHLLRDTIVGFTKGFYLFIFSIFLYGFTKGFWLVCHLRQGWAQPSRFLIPAGESGALRKGFLSDKEFLPTMYGADSTAGETARDGYPITSSMLCMTMLHNCTTSNCGAHMHFQNERGGLEKKGMRFALRPAWGGNRWATRSRVSPLCYMARPFGYVTSLLRGSMHSVTWPNRTCVSPISCVGVSIVLRG